MKGFLAAVSLLAAAGSVAASMQKRVDHTGDVSKLPCLVFLVAEAHRVLQMTWFNVPSGNDACGYPIPDNAAAVHVPNAMWRNGQNCGQWMSITSNGHQDYALVTGFCSTCDGDHIDVTQATFQSYDDPDVGIITATWKFMPMGYNPPGIEDC
ncbi:hypothetical protein FRC10_001358 [Ceratobasidium sp. 414]|nr:hypothetical protein FRC10_001358 [Ceratobasidium sp. 414]